MGAVHGINAALLLAIVCQVIRPPAAVERATLRAAAWLMGVSGAGFVGLLGTSSNDLTTSLFVLGALQSLKLGRRRARSWPICGGRFGRASARAHHGRFWEPCRGGVGGAAQAHAGRPILWSLGVGLSFCWHHCRAVVDVEIHLSLSQSDLSLALFRADLRFGTRAFIPTAFEADDVPVLWAKTNIYVVAERRSATGAPSRMWPWWSDAGAGGGPLRQTDAAERLRDARASVITGRLISAAPSGYYHAIPLEMLTGSLRWGRIWVLEGVAGAWASSSCWLAATTTIYID